MRSLLESAYSEEETSLIVTIALIGASLSLVGATFIMINYFLIKSLRNQLSYKLIFWVAVSDAIYAISNLFSITDVENKHSLCILSGMINQFGSIASLFWVVAISWTINRLMHSDKVLTKGQLKIILRYMHLIIWSSSIIITIIPLFTDTYGPSGGLYIIMLNNCMPYLNTYLRLGWCWFKNDRPLDKALRYALFYGLVWISIVYMLAIYLRAWLKIRRMRGDIVSNEKSVASATRTEKKEIPVDNAGTGDEVEMEERAEMMSPERPESLSEEEEIKTKRRSKALSRMVLFPVILIISWTFGTIRRIIELFGGVPSVGLVCIHIGMATLIGFFDALVYGLTKDVREKDKEFLMGKCGCGDYEDEDD